MRAIERLELKVPPLLLTALFAAAIWLVAGRLPDAPEMPRAVSAFALVMLGAVAAFMGVLAFRRARTTMNPFNPEAATSVVDSGIYRLSRNPMYLGFLLALVGWAVLLGDTAGYALLPLFVLYMNRFQILPEERAMQARFGEAYSAYRARVRRWL